MSARWEENTLDRLADIYVKAGTPEEREAIARCVERINARLAADPSQLGESRSGTQRVWFYPPLVVGFDIEPGGGARVYHVNKVKGDPPDD